MHLGGGNLGFDFKFFTKTNLMKNSILTSSIFIAAASMLCAQEDMIPYASPLTADATGVLYSDKAYTIGANDVTITHNRTSARHLNSYFSINVGSYTGTQLVSDSIIPSGGTGTKCFGFDGATFKGNGKIYDLTISATEEATKVGILDHGFTVDNITVNFNMSGKSYYTHSNAPITVKNNGVLNFYGARPTNSNTMSLNVGEGSEFNATFDGSGDSGWRDCVIDGKITINNTGMQNYYGASTYSNQTTANASVLNGRWALQGVDASITVNDCEVNSILFSNTPNLIMRTSTLTLNSSNAIGYKTGAGISGQDAINLEIGATSGGDSVANLVLGADNDFNQIMINSRAGSVLNIVLNGNNASFQSLSTGLIGTVYINDFAEDLIKIDSIDAKFLDENSIVSCVKAGKRF